MSYVFLMVLAALTLASCFFSASETAYVTISKHELQLADKRSLSSRLALQLLSQPERMLSLILLGNNFANVSFAAFVSAITVFYADEGLLFLASALTTLFLLIFCEVIPKIIAFYYPRSVVRMSAPLLFVLQKILIPLVLLIGGISIVLRKFLFSPKKEYAASRSLSIIRGAVMEAKGALPAAHCDLLLNFLELEGIRVEEVMKPIAEWASVDIADDLSVIRKRFGRSPHEDLLVYRRNFKQCLGLLGRMQRRSLASDPGMTKRKLLSAVEKPVYIPGSVNLLRQLDFFISKKIELFWVVDEYGELQGTVSLHDIMANLSGKTTFLMQENPTGAFIVSGNTPLREISKRLNVRLDVSAATTLQGLVYERLESLPLGAVCILEEGFRIEITELEKGRIVRAKIWRQ